jgi:hypothetical protein
VHIFEHQKVYSDLFYDHNLISTLRIIIDTMIDFGILLNSMRMVVVVILL